MTNLWKYPKFNVPSNLLEVTDEMISQWEKENNDCDEYNKYIFIQLKEKRDHIISDAELIWGERSNVVKYLLKQRINVPQLCQLDRLKSNILKIREDEKKRIQDIKVQQEHSVLVGKAIKFLTERNKIINVDFDIDSAIPTANAIAGEEAINKKKNELSESGTFIDFNGSDSCEDCRGWDGRSHRCDCGNRRVSWVSDGDFLSPYVYGEAY